MGGWMDYLRLKPAEPPIWVGAWSELGNIFSSVKNVMKHDAADLDELISAKVEIFQANRK